jgi:uncharacterized ferritin-like protein (DUF455 family)
LCPFTKGRAAKASVGSRDGRRKLSSTNGPCTTLFGFAHAILTTENPMLKAKLSQEAFKFVSKAYQSHEELQSSVRLDTILGEWKEPPEMPARPPQPILVQPRDMPSYKVLKMPLAQYLLHGLAHIELNAIDTAWDTVLRFSPSQKLPIQFYLDFSSIAADEARHFELLCARLQAKDSFYGAIPAHVGIWDGAEKTKEDFLGRLTVIQLVQEPRALDSWERLVEKFKSQADRESSQLIDLICREEIDHVRKGLLWFQYLCQQQDLDPIATFHEKAGKYVGVVPPPFNFDARGQAGMSADWFIPISKRNNLAH